MAKHLFLLLFTGLFSACVSDLDGDLDASGDEAESVAGELSVPPESEQAQSFWSTAFLRAEICPCDDDAYLWIDGSLVVTLGLGASSVLHRELGDGVHNVRFAVVNSGAWGWAARLRVVVNGQEVWFVNRSGWTGAWAGTVFDESIQLTIRNGQLVPF